MSQESSTPTDRSFVVAGANAGLRWSQVDVKLEGADVPYDGTLTLTPSYCVVTSGTSCVPTGSFDPKTLIAGGQRVRLHDVALSGKTLMLTSPDANAVLLKIALS
jgi:hypothetical protein